MFLKSGNYTLKALTLLATLSVLAITLFFLHKPLLSLTIVFYIFLLHCLIVNNKTGVIFLALSFPLVRNSFAAVTGNFLPVLFYAVFISGLIILMYGNLLGNKIRYPQLMMDKYLLALVLYSAFSILFISSEKAYGIEKLKYLLMNVVLFYLTILVIKKESDLEQVLKAIFFFGIFITFFSIISLLDMEPFFGNELAGRFTSLGMNPIWLARYFSYAILIEIYYIFKFIPNWDRHLGKISLLTLLILLQLFLSFLTGSRGPIAAMLMALMIPVLIYWGVNFKLSYIITLVGLIFIVFAVIMRFVPSYIAQRLLTQDIGGQNTTMIRLLINFEAILMFRQNIITGIGFGGFNMIYLKYPHNIITEIMSELGIPGLLLLIAIMFLAIKYFIAIVGDISRLKVNFILVLLLASFANANLSGHIGSNFFFFFSLALLYAARQVTIYNKDTYDDE